LLGAVFLYAKKRIASFLAALYPVQLMFVFELVFRGGGLAK
jgi:hypothetical protein